MRYKRDMDITMCKGRGCPIKKACYRYTSKPDQRQSYFVTPPFQGDKCEMYWGEGNQWVMTLLKEACGESKRLVKKAKIKKKVKAHYKKDIC
jgi:hypothetical protein